jgi:hypothetical protein
MSKIKEDTISKYLEDSLSSEDDLPLSSAAHGSPKPKNRMKSISSSSAKEKEISIKSKDEKDSKVDVQQIKDTSKPKREFQDLSLEVLRKTLPKSRSSDNKEKFYLSIDIGDSFFGLILQKRTSIFSIKTLSLFKYEIPSLLVKRTMIQNNTKIKSNINIPKYLEIHKELLDIQKEYPSIDYIIIQRENANNKEMISSEGAFIAYCQLLFPQAQIFLDSYDLKYSVFQLKIKDSNEKLNKIDKRKWSTDKIKHIMTQNEDHDALNVLSSIKKNQCIIDAYLQLEAAIVAYGI